MINLALGDVLADDLGGRDAEKVPLLPGNGTLDHHNFKIVVDPDDLELPDLGLGPSHPPGHLLPLVHPPWCCPRTDRTQGSVALGTVSHQTALEVVPLNPTCASPTNNEAKIKSIKDADPCFQPSENEHWQVRSCQCS